MPSPPSLLDVSNASLLELVEELTNRLQGNQPIDLSDVLRQYPAHAEQLQRLLPALEVLADLARSGCASAPPSVLLDPQTAPELGTLGDFRILRELGRGGMGVVYEAVQISLGRRVALKVLPFAAALDARQLQRFQHEAQAAAQLHHTHIVPVFQVGCERGVHFYAMQLIEGQSLHGVIHELRRLAGLESTEPSVPGGALPSTTGRQASSPAGAETKPVLAGLTTPESGNRPTLFRTIAQLGIQAAEALEHAHSLGIVHRDIKPANLLVDERGQLWIADFGLAQFKTDAGLTMTGDVVGTLRYMSPEQALGRRSLIDERTDVYSLGATLYELLTLRPAFPEQDRQVLLRRIAEDEPASPRRLNPAIPTELETIVQKAMAKVPAERYQTAQEVADDLRRFLEHRPIHARRPTLLQHVQKWIGRHQRAVLIAFGVLLVMVLGLVVGMAQVARSRTEAVELRREAEEREEEMRRRVYPADINTAYRLWLAGNLPAARTLLARYCHDDTREDLRGFEWYLLWDRCQDSETRALVGHVGLIFSVAFSPDGRLLASGGQDRVVRIWSVTDGALLAELRAHAGDINWLHFSPDGQTLASQGDEGTVCLWDVATWRKSTTLARADGKVARVFFPPGGAKMAVVLYQGKVELWNPDTDIRRELQPTAFAGPIRSCTVTPDGSLLAMGDNGGQAHIWRTSTGERINQLRIGDGERSFSWGDPTLSSGDPMVRSIAFSHDGRVAVGSPNRPVHIWPDCSPQPHYMVLPRESRTRVLAYSPDSNRLAVGGRHTVRLFDANSHRLDDVLPCSNSEVWCLAFAPDGKVLATGGDAGGLSLHRLPVRPSAERLRDFVHALFQVRLAADGKTLATLEDNPNQPVRIWDRKTGRPRCDVQGTGFSWPEGTITYSPDGQLYAAWINGKVRLLESATGRQRGESLPGKYPTFSADGSLLALVTPTSEIQLRHTATLAPSEWIDVPVSPVVALTFSPNDETLLSAHANGEIWPWDVRQCQRRGEPLRSRQLVPDRLCFSSDGDKLAAACRSKALIEVWDVPTRRFLHTLSGRFEGVADMAFSPDRKTLAVAGYSREVHLFHVQTGQELFALERQHPCLPSINFTPDGQTLITGVGPDHLNGGAARQLISWHAPRLAVSLPAGARR